MIRFTALSLCHDKSELHDWQMTPPEALPFFECSRKDYIHTVALRMIRHYWFCSTVRDKMHITQYERLYIFRKA